MSSAFYMLKNTLKHDSIVTNALITDIPVKLKLLLIFVLGG